VSSLAVLRVRRAQNLNYSIHGQLGMLIFLCLPIAKVNPSRPGKIQRGQRIVGFALSMDNVDIIQN
jgi:hypothetical protein